MNNIFGGPYEEMPLNLQWIIIIICSFSAKLLLKNNFKEIKKKKWKYNN